MNILTTIKAKGPKDDACAITIQVLTDVTLACGGRVFETHKIMLCVCSAFFRQVLTVGGARQGNKHPIVFLKDIRPKHLEQLLQYMYNGEINVLQVRGTFPVLLDNVGQFGLGG